MNIPWINKYRPKTINDIISQDDVVKILKSYIDGVKTNLPHMLLHGPPGTGKTSTILSIVNELFKLDDERVLELNASDERGINIVRTKILSFARASINNNSTMPPYKVIILDEADAMTNDAQSALRKIVEENSKITRFCFICNNKNDIIEPIKSRCMNYKFKPVMKPLISQKLQEIASEESYPISENLTEKIASISRGDLRKGITLLQHTKYIYDMNNDITLDDVYNCANIVPYSILNNIWNEILLKESINIMQINKLTMNFIKNGYMIINITQQLLSKVITDKSIDDKKKSLISMNILDCETKLINGGNEYIILLNVLLHIHGVIYDKIV